MDDLIFRKVKTAEDIRNLPGWTGEVNPKVTGLKRVIWHYHLPHEMKCSFTNCGTNHKEGVLIELEDGRVSNIGHVCGADPDRYGDTYVAAAQVLKEASLRALVLPALAERNQVNEIRSRAVQLQNGAVLWQKRVRKFASLFPAVIDELNRRRNGVGGLAVFDERERSEDEITQAIEEGKARSRDQARYYQVEIGAISGIDVIALSATGVDGIVRRSDALWAVDPAAVKPSELSRLYSDLLSLPDEIAQMSRLIDAGSRFFTSANFRVLRFLPMPSASRERLSSLTLVELDKVQVPGEERVDRSSKPNIDPTRLSKRERELRRIADRQKSRR